MTDDIYHGSILTIILEGILDTGCLRTILRYKIREVPYWSVVWSCRYGDVRCHRYSFYFDVGGLML